MSSDVGDMVFTNWFQYEMSDYLNISVDKLYFFWDRHKTPCEDYIVIQTEHFTLPNKLDSDYKKLIQGASQIFDYTEKNIPLYSDHFNDSVCQKVKLLNYNPDLNSVYNTTVEKTIDVLFYGTWSSRREKILNKIKEKHPDWNVLMSPSSINGFTKNELIENISKTRWVLCVGGYDIDDCPSDVLRTTPALNFGGNLLMEEFTDKPYMHYLRSNFAHRIQFLTDDYLN